MDPIGSASGIKVAVLVRTHIANEKLFDLLGILGTSKRYDLYLAADETRGVLNAGHYTKLSHSRASCAAHGLCTTRHNILWHCGDYPLYFAAAEIPGYDYYIMLEYDVDLVDRSAAFMEWFIDRWFIERRFIERRARPGRRGPDFVAVAHAPAGPSWKWSRAARRRYRKVFSSGIFAFAAVSRPALDYLYQTRREEAARARSPADIIHCEAFCGTALAASGFVCAGLGALAEGAVAASSFHPPSPELEVSQYPLGYYTCADPKIRMVHPVLDLPAYLDRQLAKYAALGDIARFVASLDALRPHNARDAELIASYRRKALARMIHPRRDAATWQRLMRRMVAPGLSQARREALPLAFLG